MSRLRSVSAASMAARNSISRIVEAASSSITSTSSADQARGKKSMAQNDPITIPPSFSGIPRYARTPRDWTVGTLR